MITVYLVVSLDREFIWGAGKTKKEAIQEATDLLDGELVEAALIEATLSEKSIEDIIGSSTFHELETLRTF